jgi:hypothetical protein
MRERPDDNREGQLGKLTYILNSRFIKDTLLRINPALKLSLPLKSVAAIINNHYPLYVPIKLHCLGHQLILILAINLKRFLMRYGFFVLIFLTVISACIYIGCKDTITGAQVDSVVIPGSNVSYSKYIQPVLNVHCVDCHGGSETDGGVVLISWATTTSNYNVVAPDHANNSQLVWAVQGKANYAMPPLGSSYGALNSNEVNGIITWINEGAKNN